ncbi:hypothetical protein [Phenylobacterium sp.]|uniref:hypothetical protein n=1 Tax=Phenylobacterium sp. TaxID=1871053 RepID=UPI00374D2DFC
MGVWGPRIGLTAAAGLTLAILGFYASRLSVPLPMFAGDEAAYLIRALWPDSVVQANPFVVPLNNGVHLSVIRALYGAGLPIVLGDRLVNAAAYLGGLALLWRARTRGLAGREQVALGLIALAFPYYRFAVSNLAEGLFVGVLALLCVVTGRWYRSRPLGHALLAGALGAVLVLVKPNGVASVLALGAVAGIDAWAGSDWRRLPLRVLLFAVAFFGAGNLIQWAAEGSVVHPLSFFVGDFYSGELNQGAPPHAVRLVAQAMGSMVSAMAVLAGAPIVVGLADQARRLRSRQARDGGLDLVFLVLLGALAATLVMVTIFMSKIAWTAGESGRLWGRYFEFFAPLLWLAAAPALARPIGARLALACAGVMLAGLAGLLVSLHSGIVLFPWDSSALTAFFAPDPVRAPLGVSLPYRALAAGATVGAALAMLGRRPAYAGLALTLVLAGLSTWLDHVWLAPFVQAREALARDVRAIAPRLPPQPGLVVLLAPDANDGHLGFLELKARPRVWLGPPGQTPEAQLAGAVAVVVSGPETPPGGPWMRTYKGDELSLFEPAGAP